MDFETYSEAGFVFDGKSFKGLMKGKPGLPSVGVAVYALHPSTEIGCLAYDEVDGTVQLWIPGAPPPTDLFDYIKGGGLVYAWNAQFEWWIWNAIGHQRLGWPELPLSQIRCDQARGTIWGLPEKLEKAAIVLDSKEKKSEFAKKLTIPRKPTKKDPSLRFTPEKYPKEFASHYIYCMQDVRTESAIAESIPPMSDDELQVWMVDQRINARGVAVDMRGLEYCEKIIDRVNQELTAELRKITGFPSLTVDQLEVIKSWSPYPLESLDAEHVASYLDNPGIPDTVRRVLEIRKLLSSKSVGKCAAIRRMQYAGRLYNLIQYAGARQTGRFAGRGPQPQNLPKSGPRIWKDEQGQLNWEGRGEEQDWGIGAVEFVLSGGVESCPDPLAAVAGCLRGLFVAGPGQDLICADYSAIEAVVLAILAGEQWRIEVFRTHGKIYEMSAAQISGVPFEEILEYKKIHKKHHPLRNSIGKVGELASGYGGWIGAWKNFGADKFFNNDDEIKEAILKWRDASPMIVEMWGGQPGWWRKEYYGLEGMAVCALLCPGTPYSYRGIVYQQRNGILYCKLPSGRELSYHNARLVPGGKNGGYKILHEGWNSDSSKGPVGWITMETYGGKLTENCIAFGTLVLTDTGWTRIEGVTSEMKIFDGVEFVNHGGFLYNGEKPCVLLDGIYLTPDHEVLTDEGWESASQQPRPYRTTIWDAYCSSSGENRWKKMALAISLRLRERVRESRCRRNKRREERKNSKLWVHNQEITSRKEDISWDDEASGLRNLEVHDRPMRPVIPPGVEKLWWSWDNRLRRVAKVFRNFLERYGPDLLPRTPAGPKEQQRGVLSDELPMGLSENERQKQKGQPNYSHPLGKNDGLRSERDLGYKCYDAPLPAKFKLAAGSMVSETGLIEKSVGDIVNCGPRKRFMVMGDSGPFLVHNCVQAISRDILTYALVNLEYGGYPVVLHVHDEVVSEVPAGTGSVEEFERIMSKMPPWAEGWPVKTARGWRGWRYRK